MIRVTVGEFQLDDYKLIIHPELTLSEFRTGDIPVTPIGPETKHSGAYQFTGIIDGLHARFQIEFGGEHLDKLRFAEDVVLYDQNAIDQEIFAAEKSGDNYYRAVVAKWSQFTDQVQTKQRQRHDAWLKRVIGTPPPYEYDKWGEIISLIEPRSGNVEILVRFKYDFGEAPDLKAYFKNQREQERLFVVNPQKPFVPGQLPPGFSRKI